MNSNVVEIILRADLNWLEGKYPSLKQKTEDIMESDDFMKVIEDMYNRYRSLQILLDKKWICDMSIYIIKCRIYLLAIQEVCAKGNVNFEESIKHVELKKEDFNNVVKMLEELIKNTFLKNEIDVLLN